MNFAPLAHCHPADAPYEVEFQGFDESFEAFTRGMPGELRPDLLGSNSVVLCIIMAMILIVIFNLREYPRFFSTFIGDLVSRRKRSNLFDERTVNETRVMGVFILQLCMCQALLLLPLLRGAGMSISNSIAPVAIAILAGIGLVYYLCQLGAYSLIGYVFADKDDARLWIRGYNASQALLGWTLVLPALAVLFYPSTTVYLVPVGIVLYIIARIIFLSKGFRLFYQGMSSLLYFVLYLCSVEIVPLIIAYHAIFLLYRNITH